MSTKRVKWIDCVKFIAILAVIVDHSYMSLYKSEAIQRTTYFSVTVFILLSGISSCFANRKYKYKIFSLHDIWFRLKKIVTSYLLATLIYCLVIYRFFDLSVYWKHLISFDIAGPFYFVLFYAELQIISPLLYKILSVAHNKGIIYRVITDICMLAISILLCFYTYIGDYYGGSRFLLGGTYLFSYYLGMRYALNDVHIKASIVKVWLSALALGGGGVHCGNQRISFG